MLPDLLKDRLSAVDELLFRALRAVFDERAEREKPEVKEGDDDALLGQKYRAYEDAKKIITNAFEDLKIYQTTNPKSKGFNKER